MEVNPSSERELVIIVRIRDKNGFSMPYHTAKEIADNINDNLPAELEAMEIQADVVSAEAI